MLQFIRLTALVSIVYAAIVAVGKFAPTAALDTSARKTAVKTCIASSPIQQAVHAVDYAEAVLIANGEMYFGQKPAEIRGLISGLPGFDEADGLNATEADSLDQLLQYGRQLAYAVAAQELEDQLKTAPDDLKLASADEGFSYEVLEALRGC